jgi:IS4 transposase
LAAQRARLYHLGAEPVRRSTLADANAKRSPAVFEGLAQRLVERCGGALGRRERAEAGALIRLLDSTLIRLGARRSGWAQCWKPGFAAAKLHLAWASREHLPVRWEVTSAATSDVGVAKGWSVEPGATYIFDRGYCDYAWWAALDAAGALFVTRRKTTQSVHEVRQLPVPEDAGVASDRIVTLNPRLTSTRRNPLAGELREVTTTLPDGHRLRLFTNDLGRPAEEIAALYKERWQIELVFKWLKQTLKITRQLGTSKNAVHLQILSALIAFLLLRLVAARHAFQGSLMHFARLLGTSLMERRPIATLLHPPNPLGQNAPPTQLVFLT